MKDFNTLDRSEIQVIYSGYVFRPSIQAIHSNQAIHSQGLRREEAFAENVTCESKVACIFGKRKQNSGT